MLHEITKKKKKKPTLNIWFSPLFFLIFIWVKQVNFKGKQVNFIGRMVSTFQVTYSQI